MRHEVVDSDGHWLLRCGQCEIWRDCLAGLETADALARMLDRDRREIGRALKSLQRTRAETVLRVAVRRRRGKPHDLRLVTLVRPADDRARR